MISLRFPVDDDIITDVESARDILELVLMIFWKISLAEFVLKLSYVHLQSPFWVANVVM